MLKGNRKYSTAVVLLAALAIGFGVVGTAAPPLAEEAAPVEPKESSSEFVGHFQNPPTYDSGWINITDKCGQYFTITHNLNSVDVTVDMQGKTTFDEGVHQRHIGCTSYMPGWNKTYYKGEIDWGDLGRALVQANDGGYAIASSAKTFSGSDRDFLLLKSDPCGNVQWNRTYSGPGGADYANSLVQTGDGGYAMAGYTGSYGSKDAWLVKTDRDGNAEWNKTYGGEGADEEAHSMVQTSDGGYALAGDSDGSLWLVKTLSDGTPQWNRTYGGLDSWEACSVVQATDGGYALAGTTLARDFLLVKTDVNGNLDWSRTYGTPIPERATSMVKTRDNGYAIAGQTGVLHENVIQCYLVKTDVNGNKEWDRAYSGIDGSRNAYANSVVQTCDGGYALASYTDFDSHGSAGRPGLFKTDAEGNLQWVKEFKVPYGFEGSANSVIQTSDGGYALAGGSYDLLGSSWQPSVQLMKTETEFGLAWTDSASNTITLYRGSTDPYWNFVRVRVWTIEEPTWQYGDINQDGVVDAKDLYILSRNYGKSFSVASLGGIAAIAGIRTVKKRKQAS